MLRPDTEESLVGIRGGVQSRFCGPPRKDVEGRKEGEGQERRVRNDVI